MIFVFGSNLSGVHGAGAAKHAAEHHGAVYGVGVGPTGNAYALPTKGLKEQGLPTLSLRAIGWYAGLFTQHAHDHADQQFQLTAVGCGLAGYKAEQIGPLFAKAPPNVLRPPEWRHLWPDLPDSQFWQYPAK